MKYLKNILLLLFLACIFSTCIKYPEGPYFSLRTREQRVVGAWDIEKYLVDGIDSTASKYPFPECHINFTATGKGPPSHEFGSSCNRQGGYVEQGHWEFSNGLSFHGGSNSHTVFCLTSITEWQILKLTHKKMHLQTDFNSKHYEIYLTRLE